MAKAAAVYAVLMLVAACSDAASLTKSNKLNVASFLEKVLPVGARGTMPISALGYTVVDFAWSSCGNANDRVILEILSFTEELAVSARAQFLDDIVAPLVLDLEIEKRMLFFWMKVPCLLGKFGSCVYPDVCAEMAESATMTGDLAAHGLPPGCPFPAGTYDMNNFIIRMNIEGESVANIPNFIGEGAYKVKVILKQNNKQVACISAAFDLEKV